MAFANSNNESLENALLNTKFNSELKAWYWDKTDETSKFNNKNITNFALELGLKTGDLYGFYLGSTTQIAFAPIGKKMQNYFIMENKTLKELFYHNFI